MQCFFASLLFYLNWRWVVKLIYWLWINLLSTKDRFFSSEPKYCCLLQYWYGETQPLLFFRSSALLKTIALLIIRSKRTPELMTIRQVFLEHLLALCLNSDTNRRYDGQLYRLLHDFSLHLCTVWITEFSHLWQWNLKFCHKNWRS